MVAVPAPAPPSSPAATALAPAGLEVVVVTAHNPLDVARPAETIALPFDELYAAWLDPTQTVVVDSSGAVVLSQLVDSDGDEDPDQLIFQADFAPGETRSYSLRIGTPPAPKRDQFRAYGRFVRERHDDFAWENDRIAHRMYGPGLETWPREPLTSSGVDVWTKRVSSLVIDDWYMLDAYHDDHGQGGDFYSVGSSRGCGGTGIWSDGKLWVSRNFVRSRVLANGPIRLVFELDYAPWDAHGVTVSETKHVTLDAGSHFERFESRFEVKGSHAPLDVAIGIARHGGDSEFDPETGSLRSWESLKDEGHLGCAVVLPPGTRAEHRQTPSDALLIAKADADDVRAYYAGFGWDRAADIADRAAWNREVDSLHARLAAPVDVSLRPSAGATAWSLRAANSEMARHPGVFRDRWHYETGLVLLGMLSVWQEGQDHRYFDYVKATVDRLVAADGAIRGYVLDDYNLDNVNAGKVLFVLRAHAADEASKTRYTKAIERLRAQLASQPRTREGGFWHKKIYPHQMWLDGLYMAEPFLAEYARTFDRPALYDEIAKQFLLVERHTRDPKTGLLFHGWDESKEQRWADRRTGTSPSFWARSMGWFVMALVDVLDRMPHDHPRRAALLGVLQRTTAAIASTQDAASGVWWQVLDAPRRGKNYREASASSMFCYALAKAVNHGWLPAEPYRKVVRRGYRGILERFVRVDPTGALSLESVATAVGLGGNPYRDGSFDYYTAVPVETNDAKGTGAFILASVEVAKMK